MPLPRFIDIDGGRYPKDGFIGAPLAGPFETISVQGSVTAGGFMDVA
jgi:hypothetical protein